ncbi:MAG: hypothetical protein RR525_08730 [Cellulosilyticaceae bacterium]
MNSEITNEQEIEVVSENVVETKVVRKRLASIKVVSAKEAEEKALEQKEIEAKEAIAQMEKASAEEIWQKIYNKPLNCKKHILEYIAEVQKISKETYNEAEWQGIYEHIYDSIDGLRDSIKANTVVQLQKELKAVFRKRIEIIVPKEINEFVEFFKEAYPPGKRRKDFTWVVADPNKISEEQILQTLKYISNWCNENRLNDDQKKDTLAMLKKLNAKGGTKFINQVKSLVGLRQVREFSMYIKTMGDVAPKREKPKYKYTADKKVKGNAKKKYK